MDESIRPFDLHRMFVGDLSGWFLLEIAARTLIMYLYALLVVRFMGKRGLEDLTPFEYVLIFALGSATGDPMFLPQVPVVHGMVVLSVIVVSHRLFTRVLRRSRKIEQFVVGQPTRLIHHATIDEDAMAKEGITTEELFMRLRHEGIRHLGEVEYAFLEPSGHLSVFPYEDRRQREGVSTLIP